MKKYLLNAVKTGLGSGARTISSSLFGAASSFLSGSVSDYFARKDQQRQFEYQQRLMREQDQLNRAAVDRQNAYNDPSAVSARARAAGVAPSALLGGSAGSPGVSSLQSSASSGSVGSGSRPGSSSVMDWLSKAQFDNIEANTAAANADAADKQASANLKIQSLADVQWYNANVRDLDKLLKSHGVDKAAAEAAIAEAEEAYQEWMLNPDDPANSPAASKFFASVENLRALTGEAEASTGLKQEQTRTESYKQDEIKSRTDLNIKSSELSEAQREHYESLASLNNANVKYQALINDKFEKYGLTPNSSVAGFALGLGTSLINALGGENQSSEQIFDKVFQFVKDNNIFAHTFKLSRTLDSWLAQNFELSPKSREILIDSILDFD